MAEQKGKKKPRKRHYTDYKPKKLEKPLAILVPKIVQKEGWQHVYLYSAGATVGLACSQDTGSRLRRFAEELVSLEPGWYLPSNNVECPEFGTIKVFSVVSHSQDHATSKFQQYVGGCEVEKDAEGVIRRLPIEILCHVLRPLGKHTFFEISVEDRKQKDGRKKTSAESSPQHDALVRDPELQKYIHRLASWNAGKEGLPAENLEQDAWVCVLESPTNNIDLLKAEARRAIWVSVQRARELRKKAEALKERFNAAEREYYGRLGKPEKKPVSQLLFPDRKKI